MPSALGKRLKLSMTRHAPRGEPNVFIHSLPRSGSTWLMELVLTQPGFARCNEPLNLRKEVVRSNLGIREWADLHRLEHADKLHSYIGRWCSGSLRDWRFNRPSPFTEFYRPVTHRMVFKCIHAGEEHVNSWSESFNGRVVYLVRHPIPVSLSRRGCPALDTILDSDFSRFFTDSQLAVAARTIRDGDTFACGVLDWCLRHSAALRSRTDDWTVLSYEQLVLDPLPAIDCLAKRLDLPDPDRIVRRLSVPSRTTTLSQRDTQVALAALRHAPDHDRRRWLVEKWKPAVGEHELAVTRDLLDAFELGTVYTATDPLPDKAYWIHAHPHDKESTDAQLRHAR